MVINHLLTGMILQVFENGSAGVPGMDHNWKKNDETSSILKCLFHWLRCHLVVKSGKVWQSLRTIHHFWTFGFFANETHFFSMNHEPLVCEEDEVLGGGFRYFSIFTDPWGRLPFWRIFQMGGLTTNWINKLNPKPPEILIVFQQHVTTWNSETTIHWNKWLVVSIWFNEANL